MPHSRCVAVRDIETNSCPRLTADRAEEPLEEPSASAAARGQSTNTGKWLVQWTRYPLQLVRPLGPRLKTGQSHGLEQWLRLAAPPDKADKTARDPRPLLRCRHPQTAEAWNRLRQQFSTHCEAPAFRPSTRASACRQRPTSRQSTIPTAMRES